MDKDGNDPSVKMNKFLLKYSYIHLNIYQKKKLYVLILHLKHKIPKNKKQKESYKKLETELNKKNKEKSIVLYSILCFFLNLILLAMTGFSLFIKNKINFLSNYY